MRMLEVSKFRIWIEAAMPCWSEISWDLRGFQCQNEVRFVGTNSKLMLSASRVAWPFCSTALIDKNVIKSHMRHVTLQMFTNLECKSSLFQVEPLVFFPRKSALHFAIDHPWTRKSAIKKRRYVKRRESRRIDRTRRAVIQLEICEFSSLAPCGNPHHSWVKTLKLFATNKLKTCENTIFYTVKELASQEMLHL